LICVSARIQGGTFTDGTIIATLPVGFRPSISKGFTILARANYGTGTVPPRVFLNTDGTLTMYGVSANVANEFTIYVPIE
jgi:hypothetical protein